MRFGDCLRSKREARGWTQPQAAARIEIEQSYLSKLETGKSWPSDDVFPRLVTAYEIDTGEMIRSVSSTELEKLRDISEVRSAILDRADSQKALSRTWLLAMVVCLLAGGACLGLTLLAKDRTWTSYEYESAGVLHPNEPLDAFDLVEIRLDPDQPDYESLRRRQQDLVNRLDMVTLLSDSARGVWYVENVPEGRRVFRAGATYDRRELSPFAWFIAPALALLIGAVGCGYVSRRWT